jgi:hypothetical protein
VKEELRVVKQSGCNSVKLVKFNDKEEIVEIKEVNYNALDYDTIKNFNQQSATLPMITIQMQ